MFIDTVVCVHNRKSKALGMKKWEKIKKVLN